MDDFTDNGSKSSIAFNNSLVVLKPFFVESKAISDNCMGF